MNYVITDPLDNVITNHLHYEISGNLQDLLIVYLQNWASISRPWNSTLDYIYLEKLVHWWSIPFQAVQKSNMKKQYL